MFHAEYSRTTQGLVRVANELGLSRDDVIGIVKTDNGEFCMIYYLEDESIQ